MAIAKVIVNGSTRLDLTADTVSESNMLSTYTAHDKTGAAVVGAIGTVPAATITPTESEQTAVAAGKYTSGAVKVGAIPAEYITTTDATATADQIYSGATAYVNGVKITGTAAVSVDGHRLIMPSGLISV